jgi:ligand-binding SRPBCC domain-containing protein
MALEKLERLQVIAATIEEAWNFFARPDNLATITPQSLGFKVTSPPQEQMYAGMIVTYSVTPLLGLRFRWVTEITQCREPLFFVDEQRIGPYRFWHHQHHFREVAGGVEVRDLVHYQLPFGPLGVVASGMVKRRLAEIFDFRGETIEKLFPSGRR